MIVPTMTNFEICSEILNDFDKVGIRLDSLKEKAIRKFRKEFKRENFFWEEYVHQSTKNKYVVGWYVTHNNFDKPEKICFCVVENMGKKWVYTVHYSPVESKDKEYMANVMGISTYLPHFWQRYRERENISLDKSFYEMVTLHFDINHKNFKMFPIQLNEDILRHYKEYGDYSGWAMVGRQGICLMDSGWEGDQSTLGQPDSNLVFCTVFKTYLSYRMLTTAQQVALNESIEKQLEINNMKIAEHNSYVDAL